MYFFCGGNVGGLWLAVRRYRQGFRRLVEGEGGGRRVRTEAVVVGGRAEEGRGGTRVREGGASAQGNSLPKWFTNLID